MNYPENHLPELLAPAGSYEHMKAAVLAGADAVYFGGSRYGARAYAENFTTEKVLEALDYLHIHGCRAYMTVNTLIKEKELQEDIYEYLLPFYEAGLDGVIVQDLGAASFIRRHFPGMEIHGSTQMMITSVSGALAAGQMGMNRVVPARELTAEEMRRIKEESGLEMEVFIHGALCYCYSGQCLLSSTYGGRSGNRGRCAQPCRLPYRAYDASGNPLIRQAKHLLSPKDLCTIYDLPSIVELGADSLKIEGRMKNVEFVAGVTSIYRRYLDLYASGQPYQVDPEDVYRLEELYSRGGFTDGYWYRHNGPGMMSVDIPRHLGRKIGKVNQVLRGKVSLFLNTPVNPRDILILPGDGEEEIVLTVPGQSLLAASSDKKTCEIILNAPSTKTIKAGTPVYRRHNEKTERIIQEEILGRKITYPVTGTLNVSHGRPVTLELTCRDVSVRLEGPEPAPAQKRPISEDDLLRQMGKTGNVPYTLEKLQISLEPGLFLPASAIKDLRQRAYQELTDACLRTYHRTKPSYDDKRIGQDISHGNRDIDVNGNNLQEATYHTAVIIDTRYQEDSICHTAPDQRTQEQRGSRHDSDMDKNSCGRFHGEKQVEKIVAIYQKECLDHVLPGTFFDGIILPMDFYHKEELIRLKTKIHESGKKVYLSLPRVFRQTTAAYMGKYLEDTIEDGLNWDGIYINNINECFKLPQCMTDIPRIFSSSFYQWNRDSCREVCRLDDSMSSREVCRRNVDLSEARIYQELPLELSGRECLDLLKKTPGMQAECMVYGYYPVMLSAQCVKKTLGCCNGREELYHLEDQRIRRLSMSSHCHPDWVDPSVCWCPEDDLACYNMIWSDSPRDLIGKEFHQISQYIRRVRFDFFDSSGEEIEDVIRRYERWERNAYYGLPEESRADSAWDLGIE